MSRIFFAWIFFAWSFWRLSLFFFSAAKINLSTVHLVLMGSLFKLEEIKEEKCLHYSNPGKKRKGMGIKHR